MRKTGRPTMIDVATDAGVSLKTVSRVVNGESGVDPAMIERVRAAVARLGYHRNSLAASLRSGNRDTIGFVAADLSNTFYMAVAAAVSTIATRERMHLVMASSEEDADLERTLALDLCQRQIGGLIVVPTATDHSYLSREVELGTPVVFLDRPGSGVPADAILLDNRGGARDAVAELLAAGHRRIAVLLDSPEIFTMVERLAGAREAFAAAGTSLDPALVVDGLHTPAVARDAVHRLLDAADPPTAVFCANNRVTIGALEAILPRGAEIAIAGFDDFELSRLLPRRIRIVDYDVTELGTRAAETLLARGADPATGSHTHLVPTRLVDRGGVS
ncbi:LacI family DNA-binding transcriptional regulator [uncultured Microbacterium sp.]|uniref:LacI family DNA-binding transcriptional regulator n=1 Tax=uncultured Microbacterium sp. TaxID=191216 RepID=UPI0025EC4E99|nr:LacI family DNA-binding transcriptional regulator [uncultured Microbacterium sp.]